MKIMRKITLILCAAALFACSAAKEKTRFVRKEIHSTEAQADVEAMERALAIMRSKDCSDPLSWYYQGAMHWIPDTISDNRLCDYATAKDAKDSWRNCTHTKGGLEQIHFLVWHRLYIYHFERIVREISGKEDFALPYWGYTDGDTAKMSLHSSFRNAGSSLHEACRFDSANAGLPIDGEARRALDTKKLMSCTSFEMFSANIDAAPHGVIHDYLGHGNNWNEGRLRFDNPITGSVTKDGLMGWVPTAGFDPVFWTHHSNIDRLWQKWTNSENGREITLGQLNSVEWNYSFFDEDGDRVTYTPEQIMEIIYEMDYDYDDCKVVRGNVGAPARSLAPSILAQAAPKKSADSKTIRVADLKTDKAEGVCILEVEVSFTDVPEGSYEVYVNSGGKYEVSSDAFAGFMTFFGEENAKKGDCEKGCCRKMVDGRPTKTFRFEIRPSKANLVEIHKHNGVHTGDLVIERVEIKTK